MYIAFKSMEDIFTGASLNSVKDGEFRKLTVDISTSVSQENCNELLQNLQVRNVHEICRGLELPTFNSLRGLHSMCVIQCLGDI